MRKADSRRYGRPSSGVDLSVFSDPGVAFASRSSSSGVVPRLGTEPVPVPVGDRLVEPAGLCGATSCAAAALAPPPTPPTPPTPPMLADAPETETTAPPLAEDNDEGENMFDMLDNEPILGKPEPVTGPFPVSTFRHLLGGAKADGPRGLNPPNGKR